MQTIGGPQLVDDVEEEELVGANFSNSRRESELSELQRGLRSVSATDGRLCYSGGHMPGQIFCALNQDNFSQALANF